TTKTLFGGPSLPLFSAPLVAPQLPCRPNSRSGANTRQRRFMVKSSYEEFQKTIVYLIPPMFHVEHLYRTVPNVLLTVLPLTCACGCVYWMHAQCKPFFIVVTPAATRPRCSPAPSLPAMAHAPLLSAPRPAARGAAVSPCLPWLRRMPPIRPAFATAPCLPS